MIELYDVLFNDYKKYIIEKSKFSPNVYKFANSSNIKFPAITFTMSDNIDTDFCSLGKEEKYEEYFFTINIYCRVGTIVEEETKKLVSENVISSELAILTMQYFSDKLNMKKTLNQITPNLDESIMRRTLRFQCMKSNRGNIIIRR